MRTSRRLDKVNPSLTLEIDARAKSLRAEGRDVIGLAAGEPDFPPPTGAVIAASAAMDRDEGRYTAVAGHPELRRAAAAAINDFTGFDYAADDVIVSSGAKQSIFNALYALADPGDEVLILEPYWTSYPEMCRALAITPVFVPSGPEFGIDVDAVARSITDRTRAIIVNTPSNPSGRVLGAAELTALADVLRPHDIWVISDDIYARLTFDGETFRNLAMVASDMKDRTLVVYGMSKTYCMTGWRIGFVAGPRDIIGRIKTIQSHSTSCANAIAQLASARGPRRIGRRPPARHGDGIPAPGRSDRIGARIHRRDRAHGSAGRVLRLSGRVELVRKPPGRDPRRFGAFARRMPPRSLARRRGAREAFGAPDRIRISFATSMDELERGGDRLRDFFASLQRSDA